MKTIINILRGIITSLLFLILLLVVIIQFAFTTIKLGNRSIPDLIDREIILEVVYPEKDELNDEFKNLAIDYIDQYINYIFHKRSFPSILSMNYGNSSEEEIKVQKKFLEEIRNKIDMKYENVLMLRNINNFLSNGSIYLLINIAVLVVMLLILIITSDVFRTFLLSSIALTISGMTILISSSIIFSKLSVLVNPLLYNFLKDIFDDSFKSRIFNQSLVYLGLGFVIFIVFFIMYKLKQQKRI